MVCGISGGRGKKSFMLLIARLSTEVKCNSIEINKREGTGQNCIGAEKLNKQNRARENHEGYLTTQCSRGEERRAKKKGT